MTVLTLRQQQDVFVSDAKRQLTEILQPDSGATPGWTRITTVYTITRHRTRTDKTQIVDFLVIRDNQPVYLSARISTALGRYHIPPAPWSGMVLTEERPQDVIRQLSRLLYQRDCLEVKEL